MAVIFVAGRRGVLVSRRAGLLVAALVARMAVIFVAGWRGVLVSWRAGLFVAALVARMAVIFVAGWRGVLVTRRAGLFVAALVARMAVSFVALVVHGHWRDRYKGERVKLLEAGERRAAGIDAPIREGETSALEPHDGSDGFRPGDAVYRQFGHRAALVARHTVQQILNRKDVLR